MLGRRQRGDDLAAGATIVVGDAGNGISSKNDSGYSSRPPAGSGEAAGGWGLGLALVRQIADLVQRLTFDGPLPERVISA